MARTPLLHGSFASVLSLMSFLCSSSVLAASADGDVEWDGLFSDTTAQFVQPQQFEAGDTIQLRLRSWRDDLTSADCRLFFAGVERAETVPMTREASGAGAFDHWRCSVTVPVGTTEVYFRFVVRDGVDVDYYDAGAPGDAWPVRGMSDEERAFLDFRLYVGFRSPAWAQGAVFYHIFPDRFRDGRPANNRLYPDDCLWYLDYAPASREAAACAGLSVPEVPANYSKRCLVHERWDEEPNGGPCDFFGGDLPGVTEKLAYIEDLGADALYLNPIFRASSNHKYDTMTFDQVDPRFGSNADLEALTRAVHQRGMKIILDGVFNHVSDLSQFYGLWSNYDYDRVGRRVAGIDAFIETCGAWEQNFLGEAAASQTCSSTYRNWFRMWLGVDMWDVDRDGDRDEPAAHVCGWAGLGFMPELDYGDPARSPDSGPRTWLYGGSRAGEAAVARQTVAGKWLADGMMMDEGIDGWRLDVPDNAGFFTGNGQCGKVAHDPTIWQGFRKAVKAVSEDKFISGEIWRDASAAPAPAGDWFRQRTYDAVMNYEFFSMPVSCLIAGTGVHDVVEECNDYPGMRESDSGAIDAFDAHLAKQRRVYPADAYLASQNLLSSHDSSRFRSRARGPRPDEQLRLATLLQMTLPGAPMIYYGDELGVEGRNNELGRATFPWRAVESGAERERGLREYVQALTCVRKTQPALRRGSFITLHTHNTQRTYGFARFDDESLVVVVANNADAARTVELSLRRTGFEGALVDLLSGERHVPDAGTLRVTLQGRAGALLVPEARAEASATCRGSNLPPTANAGSDVELLQGRALILDGSKSNDPEGQPLTYRWKEARGAEIGISVTAEVRGLGVGTHVFELTVSDGALRSSDRVEVRVLPPGSVVDAGVPSATDAGARAEDASVDTGPSNSAPLEAQDGCRCSGPFSPRHGGSFAWLLLVVPALWVRRRRGGASLPR